MIVVNMGNLFFVFLTCACVLEVKTVPASSQIPKLLVVSYDAFRYDYFDRNLTPYLKNLKTQGTHTDYMKNAFVTKTFPNHHTISTGLFVESHGVIDNEFYDQVSNKTVKISDELYHYNNDVLPIWALNKKAGGGRHSGVMMWPGSNFKYSGIINTFQTPWNMSITWKERVDNLISWFVDPKTPINFGMLYIEEPDYHGHGIGINSKAFNEILSKLDLITQYLHAQLKEKNLNDVNVVHLSDHGMATITIDKIVNLTKYINPADYTIGGASPTIFIYPHPGKTEMIYNSLKKASEFTKKFDVYLKKDIPKEYHYSDNTRMGPIFAVAKVGYTFDTFYADIPWFENEFNFTANEKSEFGVHGYDNNAPEMRPFFFALGPAFLPKCKVEPFDNVNLLPLFCDILDIQCPKVNGSLSPLKKCLVKYNAIDNNKTNSTRGLYIGAALIIVCVIITLIFLYLRQTFKEKLHSQYRCCSSCNLLKILTQRY